MPSASASSAGAPVAGTARQRIGFVDAQDALMLLGDRSHLMDDDGYLSTEKALSALAESKPYLCGQPEPEPDNGRPQPRPPRRGEAAARATASFVRADAEGRLASVN
jgi:hypothetical protein